MIDSRHVPGQSPATPPRGERAGIGDRLPRLEDERFLRGGGRYVSDLIATSRALRVRVLRSPHPHARIVTVDASSARTLRGVVDVLTPDDVMNVGDLPCEWTAPGMAVVPLHPVLARSAPTAVRSPS